MGDLIKQLLMATGVAWWGYILFVGIDKLNMWSAKRKGMMYQDLKGDGHDFRIKPSKYAKFNSEKETTINLKDNAEHDLFCDNNKKGCAKCEPKKKWERLNVEDDTSEDV